MTELDEKAKKNNIDMSELEKRYHDMIVTIKTQLPPNQINEAHDTRNDAKNTAETSEAENTLVENVARD